MNKATLFLSGCIAWISVFLFDCQLRADEPLPPPQTEEVWSINKCFCAVMNPESNTTIVYKAESNGRRTKSWTVEGWFRVAHLSSDGDHLVVGHDGINLLPTNVTKDEPMIRFFRRGKLLKTVTLGELITDTSNLKRTVSHYSWGSYLGFDPFDENGYYFVKTVEGKTLAFDVTTGKVASPAKSIPAVKEVPVPKEQEEGDVYIPKDLDDCFAELRRILPEKTVEAMKTGSEDDMVLYHHGLGTWLRNNWGLWKGSRLSKWFNEKGIRHADDMSGIILDSFWRHLNGQPIKLDEQIKHYQDYWKKAKERYQRNAK